MSDEVSSAPQTNYLNNGKTIKSWLLTLDHKRIAILYLCTVLVFFIIGAVGAAIFRVELMTPNESSPVAFCS